MTPQRWRLLSSWSMIKVCSEDSSEDSLRTVDSFEVEVTRDRLDSARGNLLLDTLSWDTFA